MGKSITGKAAIGCTVTAFFFTTLAFTTSHWLDNDRKLQNPKFLNIGLWFVCFQDFNENRHWYDVVFSGCWWVFEEEYYILHDHILPGFFVATQFFYTLTFTLMLVASLLVCLFLTCSRQHKHYILLLFVIGSDLLLAAISGTIAVIIFGARGDGRDWMPHWEHNDIGWSYAMAVLGVLFLYIGGALFLIEGRVHNKKKNGNSRGSSAQHSEPSKTSYI